MRRGCHLGAQPRTQERPDTSLRGAGPGRWAALSHLLVNQEDGVGQDPAKLLPLVGHKQPTATAPGPRNGLKYDPRAGHAHAGQAVCLSFWAAKLLPVKSLARASPSASPLRQKKGQEATARIQRWPPPTPSWALLGGKLSSPKLPSTRRPPFS